MDKAYNHKQFEDGLYDAWMKSGKMKANNASTKPAFTIPLPPPNVTGQLHLGHAAMLAIEDILIRYKSMTGHESLWIPGTDHAAIATENVVLKHLNAKSREEYSREEFLDHCRSFAADKHDTIVTQMQKMGAWLDWSREAYTFDEPRNHAVNTMFKMLYEDGLIERGYRMINWSVGAQSVLSDDEVEHKEIESFFYHYRYFLINTDGEATKDFVEIATTRPETLFGDTALAIHPEDPRAKDLVGRLVQVPFTNREIPIVADEHADPEFGTGMLKVTPAHDPNDFLIGERHGLEKIQVIGFDGKMMDNGYVASDFIGMTREQCRKAITRTEGDYGDLVKKYLVKHKPHTHNVGFCYRSDTIVEPMLSPQWFVLVSKEFTDRHTGQKTTLKKQMQEAVRGGHVNIVPERFDKEYFRWIDNLQDWCISRQIWWGHRIPVWYDEQNNIHLPKEQEVVFVRHGESEGNRDLKVQSIEDPLTKAGKEHALDVAKHLQKQGVSVVVTGVSARTEETADIIAKELGVEVVKIPELGSYDTKEIAGMTIDEIGRVAAIKYCKDNNKGEKFEDFVARLQVGWSKLKELQTEGKIVFVTNRSVFSVLEVLKEGGDVSDMFERRSKNSKLSHGVIASWTHLQKPAGENLRQDEDTLDTWFSSALWPFSTLGWPDKENLDLQKFYPNSVLETGWDILFFWVARMIMFGRYALGEYPFHTVYLHGMVCDEHGKKMSKSKGNGIDPLESIDEVGADAVRLSLVIGSSPGNPIPIGKNKIKGYRNFVNKLWNAGRFVQMQAAELPDELRESMKARRPGEWSEAELFRDLQTPDAWVLSRLSEISLQVKESLEKYEISAAGDAIYHFVWDEFCDWYIETTKGLTNKEVSTQVLYFAFGEILKLVHPLCPFVTETLWKELYDTESFLIESAFPALSLQNPDAERAFGVFQEVVGAVRKIRTDHKLNPKEKLNVTMVPRDSIIVDDEMALRQNLEVLKVLAQLDNVSVETLRATSLDNKTKVVLRDMDVYIEIPFDEAKEAERLEKEREVLEKSIVALEGRLANKAYTEKAPEHLVKQTQDELAKAKEQLASL